MTQPIEPLPGYELLPEGTVPRVGEKVQYRGDWGDVGRNWGSNEFRVPVARRIETPAREWIPFPPATGGREPEIAPDRPLWLTGTDGVVVRCDSSHDLMSAIKHGHHYLAWMECEGRPQPYVPPEPERPKRRRGTRHDPMTGEAEYDWTEVLPGDVDPDAAKALVSILEEYHSEATGLHARIPRDTLKSLVLKCRRSADDT